MQLVLELEDAFQSEDSERYRVMEDAAERLEQILWKIKQLKREKILDTKIFSFVWNIFFKCTEK